MAARVFVSRDTLWRLEQGDPGVALGTLVTAAFILTALNGLVTWYRPNGRLAARDIADAYADLTLRAVQAHGGRP